MTTQVTIPEHEKDREREGKREGEGSTTHCLTFYYQSLSFNFPQQSVPLAIPTLADRHCHNNFILFSSV